MVEVVDDVYLLGLMCCVLLSWICELFMYGDVMVVVRVFGWNLDVCGEVVYGFKCGWEFGFLMVNLLIIVDVFVFVDGVYVGWFVDYDIGIWYLLVIFVGMNFIFDDVFVW